MLWRKVGCCIGLFLLESSYSWTMPRVIGHWRSHFPPADGEATFLESFPIVAEYTVAKNNTQSIQRSKDIASVLVELDADRFPSKRQAKLACRYGSILVRRQDEELVEPEDPKQAVPDDLGTTDSHPSHPTILYMRMPQNRLLNASQVLRERHHSGSAEILHRIRDARIVATPQCLVRPGDVLAVQEQCFTSESQAPTHCYPATVTKYLYPPLHASNITVVCDYPDWAVVVKPENLTTIGQPRQDLQSALGFVLRPPPFPSSSTAAGANAEFYHPRPVHRLDRRTSGLVLVAKTPQVMRELSRAFRLREVLKTYTAIVVQPDQEVRKEEVTTNHTARDDKQKQAEELVNPQQALMHDKHSAPIPPSFYASDWQTIDYPIDGKPSISEWRSSQQTHNYRGHSLAMLQVRPHTGRTHQIRRHLAYCLDMPIVGDSKYDKGNRGIRSNGMFLCCHALEFPLPQTGDGGASQWPEHHPEIRSGLSEGSFVKVLRNSSSKITRVRVEIALPAKFHKTFRPDADVNHQASAASTS